MKKVTVSIFLVLSFQSLAENTSEGYVNSLESRATGFHGIWLSVPIPSQNCTNSDRAIIVKSDPGSKTQVSAILAALASGKKVVVGVNGCTDIGGGGTTTAPRVTKVQIYRE